jgi:hypothetical protein
MEDHLRMDEDILIRDVEWSCIYDHVAGLSAKGIPSVKLINNQIHR